jgi:Putative Flp pilus-assembly TadE/G-like
MEAYMQSVKNERGSVLIFATLIIVLLLIMVGMGLDTGHLAYVRSQGQPAVDSAALAAASAIPSGDMIKVTDQAAKFNPGAIGNPGAGNDYVSSSNPSNKIGPNNVTLVKYSNVTGTFITSGVSIDPKAPLSVRANGVRVALENNNPHGGTAGAAMKSPLFLTPLFNLFGQTTSNTADVSTSAVAVIRALPGLPIVVVKDLCDKGTVLLDFQSGGKSTAGWETYYIENASTDQVRALWEALPFCSGQPIVDVGYCGNIANGVNETIVNGHLKPKFKAEPDRCYLIPVIKNGGNFTQCQTITDWASFCPDKIDPFPTTGTLKGTITCGQTTYDSRDTKCYVPFLMRDAKSGM